MAITSQPPEDNALAPDTLRQIRNSAFWAFIAAALLLYFGFQVKPPSSASESGSWLIGGNILVYTMRIGGFSLLLAGVLLVIGTLIGLAVDGALSVLIGVGLALGGGLMLIQGGSNHVLYIIFGAIFVFAGRNSLNEFRRLRGATRPTVTAGGLPLFGDVPSDKAGPDQ
ncbi:MAG TPA: hypothetical protein VGM03_06895 [Phycisphaerae bacterium]